MSTSTPRPIIRRVKCPRCGAAPGKSCFRVNGKPRTRNHIARVEAATK